MLCTCTQTLIEKYSRRCILADKHALGHVASVDGQVAGGVKPSFFSRVNRKRGKLQAVQQRLCFLVLSSTQWISLGEKKEIE